MTRAAFVVLTAIFVVGPAGHTAAQTQATLPLWMAGCWAGQVRDAEVKERWFDAGGTLVGVSTTTVGGTLREFEFLRVVRQGSGVAYLAQPAGRSPTTFTATATAKTEITFENPDHDFPKRIGYRRSGDDLLAWIDGGAASSGKRQEFPMRKVACEP
jgi:hypothetical protein